MVSQGVSALRLYFFGFFFMAFQFTGQSAFAIPRPAISRASFLSTLIFSFFNIRTAFFPVRNRITHNADTIWLITVARLVQVVCNATLKIYGGDLYVGIMTVINSVREILSLSVNGLNSGAQPVLGYNPKSKPWKRQGKGHHNNGFPQEGKEHRMSCIAQGGKGGLSVISAAISSFMETVSRMTCFCTTPVSTACSTAETVDFNCSIISWMASKLLSETAEIGETLNLINEIAESTNLFFIQYILYSFIVLFQFILFCMNEKMGNHVHIQAKLLPRNSGHFLFCLSLSQDYFWTQK